MHSDIFDNDDDQEPIITKQRFKERPSTSHPTEYIRDKEEPGLVIIINQTFANDETRSERKGTENDVSELVTTFGRLGYNIEEKHILNDLKREKILQRLESSKLFKYNNYITHQSTLFQLQLIKIKLNVTA